MSERTVLVRGIAYGFAALFVTAACYSPPAAAAPRVVLGEEFTATT